MEQNWKTAKGKEKQKKGKKKERIEVDGIEQLNSLREIAKLTIGPLPKPSQLTKLKHYILSSCVTSFSFASPCVTPAFYLNDLLGLAFSLPLQCPGSSGCCRRELVAGVDVHDLAGRAVVQRVAPRVEFPVCRIKTFSESSGFERWTFILEHKKNFDSFRK